MPKKAAHSLEASSKSVALPKELSEVAEMLKSQDIEVIDQAVKAWSDFAAIKPEAADKIFAMVGVFKSTRGGLNTLDTGTRFSRNDEDKQKALIYALLSLLSKAPSGTRGAFLRENVEELEIIATEIPLLLGFKGLQVLSLRMSPEKKSVLQDRPDWTQRISALQSLRELKLTIPDKSQSYSPGSLKVFGSKQLERVDVYDRNLRSLEGLEQSDKIHTVKIRLGVIPESKKYTIDLSPLKPSEGTLNELDLYGCPVTSLAPISGCKDLRVINIVGTKIDSIKELPVMNGRSLGIPATIASLEGIERQVKITELSISTSVTENFDLIGRLSSLESLSITSESKDLPCLIGLTGLKRLKISNPSLEALPMHWPPALEELVLENCCKLVSLSRLPASLKGSINLSQCGKLQSLAGIEECTQLNELRVNWTCLDISAAVALPNTWICMLLKRGRPHETLSPWAKQLAAAPACKLRPIVEEVRSQHGLSDLNSFAAIPGLRALDLSDLDVRDPSAILRMNNLEYLQVQPRSDLSRKFGAVTISGEDKIAALKLKLMAKG